MAEIPKKFRWQATLDDGSIIYQRHPKTNEPSGYDDLPFDRVRQFELWDWDQSTLSRILLVKLAPNEKLVWRRRVELEQQTNIPVEACHVVGKLNGDGTKGMIGVFESDGSIEMVQEYLPNSVWFYPPKMHNKDEANLTGEHHGR